MRHNKKINHLGRTNTHREAMLSNMASSLIKHKRIFTTTANAKALRKYVEPLITKYIAEDPNFIPYAKNEISVKLNEKIKNFNKLVGDNISSQLVKEFLQGYLSNRFGDKPNE